MLATDAAHSGLRGYTTFSVPASEPVLPATDFVAGDSTTGTLTFSWTAPTGTVSGYRVEYSLHGTDTWTDGGIVTEATATLSGLDAGSLYDVRVWTQSGETESPTALTGSMTTASDLPVDPLPSDPPVDPVPSDTPTDPVPSDTPTDPVPSDSTPVSGPAPVDDAAQSVTAYVATDLDVLANDPEGAVLDAITTAPQYGTATIIGSTIRYTADLAYSGTDSLQYTIQGSTDPATVTLDVAAYQMPANAAFLHVSDRTSTSMTWSWLAAVPTTSAVAGYVLSYRRAGSEDPWVEVSTSALTHTATSLVPDTLYEYGLVTYDVAGQRSQGQSAAVPTLPAPPAVPTGLEVLPLGASSVGAIWNAVPDERVTSYKVSYGLSADGPWVGEQSVTSANANLGNLDPRTTYAVRVAACLAGDICSDYSPPASATTDGRAPVADSVTAYDGYEQQIDVLINDPDDPTTATVVDGPTAGRVVFSGGLFHYTVTDPEAVSDSFTYHNDVSQQVATVTIQIDPIVVPSAPLNLQYSRPDRTHVTVTWEPPANESDVTFGLGNYAVLMCVYESRACDVIPSQSVAGTSATFEIDPAESYFAYVYPRDSRGGGWDDARILVTPTAGNDTGYVYDRGSWPIDVLANDMEGPTTATVVDQPTSGTVVFRNGAFYYTASVTGPASDSFTYRNDVSQALVTVSVDIASSQGPTFASDILLEPATTSVRVGWDGATPGSAGIAGYRVYVKPYRGSWTFVTDTANPSVTSVDVTDLRPGTDYMFYVQAYDSSGLYANRISLWTTTLDAPPTISTPDAVTDLVADNATTTSIDLSWSEPTSAQPIDGYDVYYAVADSEEWQYYDYISDTAVTVTDLDADTAYDFKVVAWDITDDDPSSADSNIATATTDAEPRVAPINPQLSTPPAIVSGGTADVTVSGVSESAVVEAGSLGEGVAEVTIDGLTAHIRVGAGVTGLVDQPLVVTDGVEQVTVIAHVVVNPRAVARAYHQVTSAAGSRVSWAAAAGARSYVVTVGGRTVCTTASLRCSVPSLLGSGSLVRVVVQGADGTLSTAVRSVFVSRPVVLGHVHFIGDSPVMTSASAATLRNLATQLAAAGVTRITIHGYTATQGTQTHTTVQMRLSLMRAKATAAALTALMRTRGVAVRVTVVADGAAHPIASNTTAAGRAENRRAEVTIG